MCLVCAPNQLRGKADVVAAAAETRFENVVRTELAGNLAGGLVGVLVRHRRGPGNDGQPRRIQNSQFGDDLLSQAVGDVVTRRIPAEVLHGQRSQHHAPGRLRARL
jgi:hypothetical protein